MTNETWNVRLRLFDYRQREDKMARDRQHRQDLTSGMESGTPLAGPSILAIGDVSLWRSNGRSLPADGEIHFAEFHEVGFALLETLKPDVVLSPLLSAQFDCIDLAQKLSEAGFTGRYRAMSPPIPNPQMVQMEIQTMYPSLDFDIVSYAPRLHPKVI